MRTFSFFSHILLVFAIVAKVTYADSTLELKLLNHVGSPLEIFWVNPKSKPGDDPLIPMGPPLYEDAEVGLTSFQGHQFVARISSVNGTISTYETRFTKGAGDEQLVFEFDNSAHAIRAKFMDSKPRYSGVLEAVNDAARICRDLRGKAFSSCMAGNIVDDVTRLTDSKALLKKHQDLMSSRLRNYTCVDDSMETSTPVGTYEVTLAELLRDYFHDETINIDGELAANINYTVHVMLDTDHAKIWMVEDFIRPEECDVLMKYGRPRLTRATVAAEDGTSIISEARKANQASYEVRRRAKGGAQDPLWPLFNRIISMTNHHSGYNLTADGQEGFTIIQYDPNDQYSPHCDGACEGEAHIPTGRISTAVMYCKAAERGGATAFTKADVFVKPKVGSTTFFSYKGSDGRMDSGLTEHSGCPVLQGEKFITALWLREGVSGSKPWTKYDPSGIPIATYDRNGVPT